ncbi:MAG: PilN domain-containing protein [Gemmatimonadota bacterium]|nr:PilN domain-containing protein [Gemmatimonadota bacterium]
MIEVNLHPGGAKGGATARRSLRLPSFGRGGPSASGRDPWTIAAIAVPAVVLLAIGWMWFSARSHRAELNDRIAVAVEDSTRLSDLRLLSDSLIAREARIRQRLDLVQSLDGGRFVWPHVLDEIGRSLPAYTWLTLVRREAPFPDLRIQVDGLAANPLAITRFVRNLEESPYIAEARILGSQQQVIENVAAQAFQLMVTYEVPPDELLTFEPLVN